MYKHSWISFFCCFTIFMGIAASSTPCNGAPAETQSIPQQMGRLLHKDTTIFGYIPSAVEFAESLKILAESIDPKRGNAVMSEMNSKSLLGSLVLTKNEIMIDQPIGIGSWGTSEDDDMPYVVIFRVQGATPKTVMAKGKGRRLMFLEGTDWVAVTNAKASWPAAAEDAPLPEIVRNMLPGQCAVSFDQVGFIGSESHKSINTQIKKSLKGSVAPEMQQHALDMLESLAYGFKRWDFAVVVEGGDLSFDSRYEPTADSEFAITGTPGLEQLGHRLPGQLAFQAVVSTVYTSNVLKWMKPFIIAQAGKDKQMAASLLADISALVAGQRGGSGMAAGMSEYGLDVAQVFQVEDTTAMFGLIDAYVDDINAAKAGLHYKRMRVLIGGDSARLYEVTFDKKDMKEANPMLQALVDSELMEILDASGEDKIYLRIISDGNWMAAVAGEPKLLGRMRRALSQPSAFNPNLDHVSIETEGDLIMAMSIDLRSLFNGILAYVQAHPKELTKDGASKSAMSIIAGLKPMPGPSAVMSVSAASHEDGAVMSRFECDVKQIAELGWQIWGKVEKATMQAEEAAKAEKAGEK